MTVLAVSVLLDVVPVALAIWLGAMVCFLAVLLLGEVRFHRRRRRSRRAQLARREADRLAARKERAAARAAWPHGSVDPCVRVDRRVVARPALRVYRGGHG